MPVSLPPGPPSTNDDEPAPAATTPAADADAAPAAPAAPTADAAVGQPLDPTVRGDDVQQAALELLAMAAAAAGAAGAARAAAAAPTAADGGQMRGADEQGAEAGEEEEEERRRHKRGRAAAMVADADIADAVAVATAVPQAVATAVPGGIRGFLLAPFRRAWAAQEQQQQEQQQQQQLQYEQQVQQHAQQQQLLQLAQQQPMPMPPQPQQPHQSQGPAIGDVVANPYSGATQQQLLQLLAQAQLQAQPQAQPQLQPQQLSPRQGEEAVAASCSPSGSPVDAQSNTTMPTLEQALQIALHGVQTARSDAEVHQVVRTLAIALGASRTEVGTIKAVHAVLLQLLQPDMSDAEACSLTTASNSNFAKWRKRMRDAQLL